MKKIVFVVRVDDYFPELCEITTSTIKHYADKIGAEYREIRERKFLDFPPTYEKMQIFELGKNYDFCLLIDADFVIHKDAPDFTMGILPGYVGFLFGFNADTMFEIDDVFMKDGRNIGIASNFVLTDRLTHNLWKPLDISWAEAKTKTKREFIIDEYCLSRNFAEHRFNFTGLNYCEEIKYLFRHIGVSEKDKYSCLSEARSYINE